MEADSFIKIPWPLEKLKIKVGASSKMRVDEGRNPWTRRKGMKGKKTKKRKGQKIFMKKSSSFAGRIVNILLVCTFS